MTPSLNERFKTFMSQLPLAEAIDCLELPPGFDRSKRADFLVESRRAIMEVKSLEADPQHKVNEELQKHQGRPEYPRVYGQVEVRDILRCLPDGEKIYSVLFQKLSHSVEQSFREADKQIGATKEIFHCPGASGILVLLNQTINSLTPELLSQRVSQLLTRTDPDGSLHYKNITNVWFIMESFSLRISPRGGGFLPSIVIWGPTVENRADVTELFNTLQSKWASFNGVPL